MAERPQERCKTAAAQQAAAEAAVTPDTSLPPRPPLLPASTAKIVVWQAILPSSGPACHLHEALRHLCPERFPSTTSAKRAVRRSEVLLDGGRVIDPSRTLVGGEMLQVVAREGASQMRWYPQHALKGEQSSAVTDAASKYNVAAAIPQPLRLRILFEDDHMACLVKPPGIPTDSPSGRGGGTTSSLPAPGTPGDSDSDGEPDSSSGGRGMQLHAPGAYQQMTHLLTPSTAVGALRRPRHVHRLDEPTGGLLLAAKTRLAQQELCAAFEQRRVTKRYTALVWGRLEGQGIVRYSLNGRACETEYRAVRHTRVDMAALGLSRANPLGDAEDAAAMPCANPSTGAAGGAAGATSRSHCVQDVAATLADSSESGEAPAVWVTTVDLYPHTGRKHQLRRHMALMLHPILGDPKHGFGYRAQRHLSGQSLAADSHCELQEAAAEAGAAAAALTEVHAPDRPLQAPALLQAAAAVATQRLQLKLCLWAVELRLKQHPVTGKPLPVFSLPEPAAFAATRDLLGNTCWVSAGATT